MSYENAPHGNHRPKTVDVAASLLAIVALISAGRVAFGVLDNLSQDGWSSGGRAMFLILNAIVLVFSLLILVLAYQVRRGRMWAWITSLVLLPFTFLFGVLMLLITVMGHGVPLAGTGLVVFSLVTVLALTVPRSARDYFLRKPAHTAPMHAAAAPGQAWGYPSA